MELRYALMTGVLLGGSAVAQWANPRPAMYDLRPATEQAGGRLVALPMEAGDVRDGGDVVFNEDFANGLDGNNGIGPWTTSGPDGALWLYDTDGPNGDFSNTNQRIGAPATFQNGFMIFDSNFSNNGCVDAGTCTDREGALVSPVLDLSATPFVEIEWVQRLRFCCTGNPIFVDVSTDGGTTWPNRFEGAPGRAVNNDPGTVVQKVNITAAIAADPTNVRIRFFHEPVASHYHWQIDDVKIVELYDFDLRMTASGITSWNSSTALTYDSIRYSVYPFSQLRPMGLNMTVLNNGSETQDDAVANFTVTSGGTTVLDQDQPVANFEPGETRTVFVDPSFTPPAEVGNYTVDFSISSGATDQTPNDNTGTANFSVSQYVYGRDLGTLAGSNDGNGDGGVLILCNAFHVSNNTDLHGLSLAMATSSEAGSIIVGEVRADDLETVLGSTDELVVTSNMFSPANGSNFVTMQLLSPVSLTAGGDYMACIQVYGTVAIGTNGVSEPQTSFIYYEGSAGEDWYYTTSTPMIRMTFDPTLSIEEADRSNGLGLGQNFPNPANGVTTIPFDLERDATVSLQMHDVSGKLVMEQHLGRRATGTHRLEIATDQLNEGVYFYTLTAGEAQSTKRMTVIR